MAERPRVIFAFMPAHAGRGSKIMRVDQLALAASELIGDRWDIQRLGLPRAYRQRRLRQAAADLDGALVIFLKGAFCCGDADVQARWSNAARAVAIDYVDTNIDQKIEAPVTLHIAASERGQNAISEHLGDAVPVRVLDHHWDPRLEDTESAATEFTCGYFGHPANATLTKEIENRLTVGSRDGFEMTPDTISKMSETALHYGVREIQRSTKRTVFKPFTKGFTAAAVGGNILVNRDVDDAERFLGDDYPFLIDGKDEATVLTALDKANTSFATPVWDMALDRMKSIRSATSLSACVGQLDKILTELMAISGSRQI